MSLKFCLNNLKFQLTCKMTFQPFFPFISVYLQEPVTKNFIYNTTISVVGSVNYAMVPHQNKRYQVLLILKKVKNKIQLVLVNSSWISITILSLYTPQISSYYLEGGRPQGTRIWRNNYSEEIAINGVGCGLVILFEGSFSPPRKGKGVPRELLKDHTCLHLISYWNFCFDVNWCFVFCTYWSRVIKNGEHVSG